MRARSSCNAALGGRALHSDPGRMIPATRSWADIPRSAVLGGRRLQRNAGQKATATRSLAGGPRKAILGGRRLQLDRGARSPRARRPVANSSSGNARRRPTRSSSKALVTGRALLALFLGMICGPRIKRQSLGFRSSLNQTSLHTYPRTNRRLKPNTNPTPYARGPNRQLQHRWPTSRNDQRANPPEPVARMPGQIASPALAVSPAGRAAAPPRGSPTRFCAVSQSSLQFWGRSPPFSSSWASLRRLAGIHQDRIVHSGPLATPWPDPGPLL